MNEHEIELFARINLHEFLLEQFIANQAMKAMNPELQWENFSKSIIEKVRFGTTSTTDAPDVQLIHTRMIEMTERFCEKVKERVHQGYK